MVVKLKWPWLGIAIPSFLIAFIGYTAHLFVLSNFLSNVQLLWFQFSLTMIWMCYYKAIYTNPGSPPEGYEPSSHEWRIFCRKCNNFKPERCHHCKTCGQCVLLMDHHCPWTMNCVGYRSFPHFMRFLFWIICTAGYLAFHLIRRITFILYHRYSDQRLVPKRELIFITILTPLDAFILITITLLFIRCAKNQFFKGMSQIECWEMDRLENLFYSKRLLPQLIQNLGELFPNSLVNHFSEIRNLSNNCTLLLEDVVNFPYDLDLYTNIVNCMGPVQQWLNPFNTLKKSGVNFQKNDNSIYEPDSMLTDKLLALPWPPDGGRHLAGYNGESGVEVTTKDGEKVVRRKRFGKKPVVLRKKWYNDWGENLEHFGVDIEAEE